MADVMDADPFTAIMDRSRQELRAILQKTEASRTTLGALEDSLRTTQESVVAAQAQLATAQQAVRDAEAQSAKLLADARTTEGVVKARAAKEAKSLVDDAKARIAAALAHLQPPTKDAAA